MARVSRGCILSREGREQSPTFAAAASQPGTRQRLGDGYGPTDGPPVADAGPLRPRALGPPAAGASVRRGAEVFLRGARSGGGGGVRAVARSCARTGLESARRGDRG